MIAFSSPLLDGYQLPFDKFPIVTDVTYKATKGGEHRYLCSSVIFVPFLKKSIVFFQAIIGGLSFEYFVEYFYLLFKTFNMTKNFLGVLMDFSAAQRQGFLSAFNKYFDNNNNNGGGTVKQINEARSFLKGCFMHWMQSVCRISRNNGLVPFDQTRVFLDLVYKLRVTEYKPRFDEICLDLLKKFPGCRRWLKWWLQPSVKAMIFRCESPLKSLLLEYSTRTSNSVEAYHNALYHGMTLTSKSSLPSAIGQILQFNKKDGSSVDLYLKHGVSPSYGTKKQHTTPSSKKTKATTGNKTKKPTGPGYKYNDGRPPDTNESLYPEKFGGKKKKEVSDEQHFKSLNRKKRKARPTTAVKNSTADDIAADDFDERMKKEEKDCFGLDVHLDELDLSTLDLFSDNFMSKSEALNEDFWLDEEVHIPGEPSIVEENDAIPGEEAASGDRKTGVEKATGKEAGGVEEAGDGENAGDGGEEDDVDLVTEFVYLSHKLNPNRYNSCFIDAPFEMLIRCILPFNVDPFSDAEEVIATDIDRAIMSSYYYLYVNNKPDLSSKSMRDFAWTELSFKKNEKDDPYCSLLKNNLEKHVVFEGVPTPNT